VASEVIIVLVDVGYLF